MPLMELDVNVAPDTLSTSSGSLTPANLLSHASSVALSPIPGVSENFVTLTDLTVPVGTSTSTSASFFSPFSFRKLKPPDFVRNLAVVPSLETVSASGFVSAYLVTDAVSTGSVSAGAASAVPALLPFSLSRTDWIIDLMELDVNVAPDTLSTVSGSSTPMNFWR